MGMLSETSLTISAYSSEDKFLPLPDTSVLVSSVGHQVAGWSPTPIPRQCYLTGDSVLVSAVGRLDT